MDARDIVRYPGQGFEERLLALLGDEGHISPAMAEVCMHEFKTGGTQLSEILDTCARIDPWLLQCLCSRVTGYPAADLRRYPLRLDLIRLFDMDFLTLHAMIPFAQEDGTLHLAMADPSRTHVHQQAQLRLSPPQPVKPFHAVESLIVRMLHQARTLHGGGSPAQPEGAGAILQDLLNRAALQGASDLHFHPASFAHTQVSLRLLGELSPLHVLHRDVYAGVLNRAKILGELDIAVSRKPQSGEFSAELAGASYDCRMSVHPVIYGESLVIRLLSRDFQETGLAQLGFSMEQVRLLEEVCRDNRQGMILVSGATGSGKTTAVHALLRLLRDAGRHIMTLEEPVEYRVFGVRQTSVRPGETDFAQGLKSLLRQDPDVIFIGEIRDGDTARLAVQAGLTGHLVFSTVHAAHPALIPLRFADMGISPGLLASKLLLCVSLRWHGTGDGRSIEINIYPLNADIREAICEGISGSKLETMFEIHKISNIISSMAGR